jgi:crotonobetainyl-CoA:carnitine CoA-transferase CaiB-like acyl-CoA transferase
MDCFVALLFAMTLKQPRCIPHPTWVKWHSNGIISSDNSGHRNNSNKRHRSDATMEKGIFEGLKVLDCASFIAAPAAATVLSDFGADVIKIEPPGTGDPYRNLPNLPGYPRSEHNFAWMLESRNKKSLALDLTKEDAQTVLYRLVTEADVFITNLPPQVRAKLGITHDHLGHLNDRLIYASFTGYGEKGAEANKPGFDSNAYWARSGLMDLVRADEHTTPARSIAGMGDHPCAMAFYGAIVTALYKRERTGKGSHVSSNLMANGVWAASVLAQAKLVGAKFGERRPRERALNAVTNHYQCKDGRWLILSLLNEDRQWPTLARCLEREDLVTDPRFATKPDRHARSLELIKIFDGIFAGKPLAEWRKILDGNGLVFGVVGILDDIPNDQQMIDNEVLVPFENDTMLTISSPIWVDGSKKVQPRKPPGLGEHSDEILRNAGYDEAAIEKLRSSGAVA